MTAGHVTIEQVQQWMAAESEDEHLEFKEAKQGLHLAQLCRYCVALANEGGGVLVLGVTDKRPRRIAGTMAVGDPGKTKMQILDRVRMRVEIDQIQTSDGRVVVVRVPPRPLGTPLEHDGAYLMRVGESLRPMTPAMLRQIFAETGPDYSAEVCADATITSLSPEAIDRFRATWARKSGQPRLEDMPPEQLLADAELLVHGRPTYAALVLLGTREALGRYLAQAEVVFEYRSTDTSIEYQARDEHRKGLLLFHDDLWQAIDNRNDIQHYQEGLFKWDIPTFNERSVREAILNAVAHRDYRLPGSVFVCQYPRWLSVTSPGGFPPGVTEENILWQRAWRNRRLAEALAKCGLVERSGQGIDLMFENCLREGKPRPDFAGTHGYQVCVTLRGTVSASFVRFLESVSRETQTSFSVEDMLVLDLVHREERVPDHLWGNLHRLLEAGAVERRGQGRGARHHLARRYYRAIGKLGTYTRKAGLDRETNKQLLLKHIRENAADGSRLNELWQVLPELSRVQVQRLLRELKDREDIHCVGRTNAGRWYPGPRGGIGA